MNDDYKLVQIDLDISTLPDHTIQSSSLAKVPGVQPILFKFAVGESLSEHTSSNPAILIFLSGRGVVTLGSDRHDVEPGSWIYMPAHLPHSVVAVTPLVMLLEMLRDDG